MLCTRRNARRGGVRPWNVSSPALAINHVAGTSSMCGTDAISHEHIFNLNLAILGAALGLQGYLANKTPPPPVGPYSRPMSRDLW